MSGREGTPTACDTFCTTELPARLVAQFISASATVAIIAFFALLLDRTGDVASLGLLAGVQILPGILIGPFAGVLIDRWSRRAVMVTPICWAWRCASSCR